MFVSAGRDGRSVLYGADAGGAALEDRIADNVVGLGVLRQRDHQAVRADDSHLFARDFSDRVAEILLMIERDVGDNGNERVDDVGSVESAPHTNFENGD